MNVRCRSRYTRYSLVHYAPFQVHNRFNILTQQMDREVMADELRTVKDSMLHGFKIGTDDTSLAAIRGTDHSNINPRLLLFISL